MKPFRLIMSKKDGVRQQLDNKKIRFNNKLQQSRSQIIQKSEQDKQNCNKPNNKSKYLEIKLIQRNKKKLMLYLQVQGIQMKPKLRMKKKRKRKKNNKKRKIKRRKMQKKPKMKNNPLQIKIKHHRIITVEIFLIYQILINHQTLKFINSQKNNQVEIFLKGYSQNSRKLQLKINNNLLHNNRRHLIHCS